MVKYIDITKTKSPDFPFSLSAVKHFTELELGTANIFVGENGSGKSTILEAIAIASKLPTAGGEKIESELAKYLKISWDINRHKGFFMRAEDFFSFIKQIRETKNELIRNKQDYEGRFSGYGKLQAVGSMESQIREISDRYGNMEEISHGEGFLRFFQSRIVPGGLFLLDEPEAALSPTRQLTLISIIKESIAEGSQFIIATHSPILMALPEARIFEFTNAGIRTIEYADIGHVKITKAFLENPKAFLRRL